MKRKIAILMASMMALTAPMNAFAAYFNGATLVTDLEELTEGSILTKDAYVTFDLNKNGTIHNGDTSKGEKGTITLENGEFLDDEFDVTNGVVGSHLWASKSGLWNNYKTDQEKTITTYIDGLVGTIEDGTTIEVTMTSTNGGTATISIPYAVVKAGASADAIVDVIGDAISEAVDYSVPTAPVGKDYDGSVEVDSESVDYTVNYVVDADFADDVFANAAVTNVDEVITNTDDDGLKIADGNEGLKSLTAEFDLNDDAKDAFDELDGISGYGVPYVIEKTDDIDNDEATIGMLYDVDEDLTITFVTLKSDLTKGDLKVEDEDVKVYFDELVINFKGVQSTSEDDITVTVDGDIFSGTSSGKTVTITTGGEAEEVEASASVSSLISFYGELGDAHKIQTLTFNYYDSDKAFGTENLSLKLTNGFKFCDEDGASRSTTIVGCIYDAASGGNKIGEVVMDSNDSSNRNALIEFNNIDEDDFTGTFYVRDLYITPTSDVKKDVTIDFNDNYNTNITVKVGKRGTPEFALTTPYVRETDSYYYETLPTIYTGRSFRIADRANVYGMEQADNISAIVNFRELISGSLDDNSTLSFEVPEGVKIVNVVYDSIGSSVNMEKYASSAIYSDSYSSDGESYYKNRNENSELAQFGLNSALTFDFADEDELNEDAKIRIINDGKTLSITKNAYDVDVDADEDDETTLAMMQFRLELSVDPYYVRNGTEEDIENGTRDIVLTASNAGADSVEVVIAQAQEPFKFEIVNSTISVDSLEQSVPNKVVMTETYSGAFLEQGFVVLDITDSLGDKVYFKSADVTIDSSSKLDYDYWITKEGRIMIEILESSQNDNLATITVDNITVENSNRAPQGSYTLQIGGESIINNYWYLTSKERVDSSAVINNKINDLGVLEYNYDVEEKESVGGYSYYADSSDVNAGTNSLVELNTRDAQVLTDKGNALVNLLFQQNASVYSFENFITLSDSEDSSTSSDDVVKKEKFEGVVAMTIDSPTIVKEVNGVNVPLTPVSGSTPFIKTIDGYASTLAPVRAIADAIGAEIKTDTKYIETSQGMQYVTYADFYLLDGTKLTLTDHPDKSNVVVFNDTTSSQLAIPVQNENGRFFVPVRALGDLLGIGVHWENGTYQGGSSIYGPNGTAFYYSSNSELNAFVAKHYTTATTLPELSEETPVAEVEEVETTDETTEEEA